MNILNTELINNLYICIMDFNSKIYIAGHTGMLGSNLFRTLIKQGYTNIVTKSHSELDIRRQEEVENFFKTERPEYVFFCAVNFGGIKYQMANSADILYDNSMMTLNIMNCCKQYNVKKIVLIGSSCIYPSECLQPMKEEYLLNGTLDYATEGYAISKILGIKLSELYLKQHNLKSITLVPCNLYGPGDSFDPKNSRVLCANIKKFVDAVDNNETEVIMWGTGNARREFLHVQDLVDATIFYMNNDIEEQFINIGNGYDYSIKEMANIIAEKTGYNGKIIWDTTQPEGSQVKCLDVTKMKKYDFIPKITLEKGIEEMIKYYKELKK